METALVAAGPAVAAAGSAEPAARLWAHTAGDSEHAPLRPGDWLTTWTFDPWLAAVVVLLAGLYLWGVLRLRSRGDHWSPWRTLAFLGGGVGGIVVATQSALAVYDDVLVTPHMLQHMVLSMLAPIFLALGAPVTLALRVLPASPRRGLSRLIHSRVARVLAFPVVGGMLFVLSPFALYFTGWYEATLRNLYLHEALHLHFLLVGCLWFWPLLGLDPVPGRLAYPFRLLASFMTVPFHAFLGIAIMSGNLLAEDYYTELGRTWGPSLVEDQRTAGGLLWATGDLVAFVVMAVLFVQWVRASEREAAREDRRLDRLEEEARRAAAGREEQAPSTPPVAEGRPPRAAEGGPAPRAAEGGPEPRAAEGGPEGSQGLAGDARVHG